MMKKEVKVNYQRMLDKLLERLTEEQRVPSLLLHSCCAPCSSYVIEYLSEYFKITVLYYNPNLYPQPEYFRRVDEQKRFIDEFPAKYPVDIILGDYDTKPFYQSIKGMEKTPEGGLRCMACFNMRLAEAAKVAKEKKYDYFGTTLTISPHKDSQVLNRLGAALEEDYQVNYLYADFKKRGGFKRSVELSAQYNLYRQNYCACVFSMMERDKRAEQKKETV